MDSSEAILETPFAVTNAPNPNKIKNKDALRTLFVGGLPKLQIDSDINDIKSLLWELFTAYGAERVRYSQTGCAFVTVLSLFITTLLFTIC